jgi:glycine/D-amino acid oxidase-like deaminating enzyme
MEAFDVAVLGAGIVGAAAARECVLAGLRVAIVEPGVPGGAASAAGMGHVVVMDDSPAQLALSHLGREMWQQMRPMLPPMVEYEARGTLWIAANDEEMAEVHGKRGTYAASGVASEALDAQAVAEAEPNLRPGLAGGLLVPDDAVVYPPAAARFFLEEALRGGAELRRGLRATAAANGRVKLEDGSSLLAGTIVVASGTDTSLVPSITIRPRKGHLIITDRYPGFVHHQLVELGYLKSAHGSSADSVAFNVQPRQTGQLLLGSSRQFGDEDPSVDARMLKRMIDRALEYLPGLRQLSAIRAWTGFRASTPDKLPLIGPTQDPTVHLLMGFEGLGITNAPSAARLCADYLLGRTPCMDGRPFLPERLAREVAHA